MGQIPVTHISEDGKKVYLARPFELPKMSKQSDDFRLLFEHVNSKLVDTGQLDQARNLYKYMMLVKPLQLLLATAGTKRNLIGQIQPTPGSVKTAALVMVNSMAFDTFLIAKEDDNHVLPDASRLAGIDLVRVGNDLYDMEVMNGVTKFLVNSFMESAGRQLQKDFGDPRVDPGKTRLASYVAFLSTIDSIAKDALVVAEKTD